MTREVVALAVMGIDQHENGIVAVSRVLMEAQMQVNYLGVCQTPDSVVDQAIGSNADVIGISPTSATQRRNGCKSLILGCREA